MKELPNLLQKFLSVKVVIKGPLSLSVLVVGTSGIVAENVR